MIAIYSFCDLQLPHLLAKYILQVEKGRRYICCSATIQILSRKHLPSFSLSLSLTLSLLLSLLTHLYRTSELNDSLSLSFSLTHAHFLKQQTVGTGKDTARL